MKGFLTIQVLALGLMADAMDMEKLQNQIKEWQQLHASLSRTGNDAGDYVCKQCDANGFDSGTCTTIGTDCSNTTASDTGAGGANVAIPGSGDPAGQSCHSVYDCGWVEVSAMNPAVSAQICPILTKGKAHMTNVLDSTCSTCKSQVGQFAEQTSDGRHVCELENQNPVCQTTCDFTCTEQSNGSPCNYGEYASAAAKCIPCGGSQTSFTGDEAARGAAYGTKGVLWNSYSTTIHTNLIARQDSEELDDREEKNRSVLNMAIDALSRSEAKAQHDAVMTADWVKRCKDVHKKEREEKQQSLDDLNTAKTLLSSFVGTGASATMYATLEASVDDQIALYAADVAAIDQWLNDAPAGVESCAQGVSAGVGYDRIAKAQADVVAIQDMKAEAETKRDTANAEQKDAEHETLHAIDTIAEYIEKANLAGQSYYKVFSECQSDLAKQQATLDAMRSLYTDFGCGSDSSGGGGSSAVQPAPPIGETCGAGNKQVCRDTTSLADAKGTLKEVNGKVCCGNQAGTVCYDAGTRWIDGEYLLNGDKYDSVPDARNWCVCADGANTTSAPSAGGVEYNCNGCDAATPKWNQADNKCVECMVDNDCSGGGKCLANECKDCINGNDCDYDPDAETPSFEVCNAAGSCEDCPNHADGYAQFGWKKENGASGCGNCTIDDHCAGAAGYSGICNSNDMDPQTNYCSDCRVHADCLGATPKCNDAGSCNECSATTGGECADTAHACIDDTCVDCGQLTASYNGDSTETSLTGDSSDHTKCGCVGDYFLSGQGHDFTDNTASYACEPILEKQASAFLMKDESATHQVFVQLGAHKARSMSTSGFSPENAIAGFAKKMKSDKMALLAMRMGQQSRARTGDFAAHFHPYLSEIQDLLAYEIQRLQEAMRDSEGAGSYCTNEFGRIRQNLVRAKRSARENNVTAYEAQEKATLLAAKLDTLVKELDRPTGFPGASQTLTYNADHVADHDHVNSTDGAMLNDHLANDPPAVQTSTDDYSAYLDALIANGLCWNMCEGLASTPVFDGSACNTEQIKTCSADECQNGFDPTNYANEQSGGKGSDCDELSALENDWHAESTTLTLLINNLDSCVDQSNEGLTALLTSTDPAGHDQVANVIKFFEDTTSFCTAEKASSVAKLAAGKSEYFASKQALVSKMAGNFMELQLTHAQWWKAIQDWDEAYTASALQTHIWEHANEELRETRDECFGLCNKNPLWDDQQADNKLLVGDPCSSFYQRSLCTRQKGKDTDGNVVDVCKWDKDEDADQEVADECQSYESYDVCDGTTMGVDKDCTGYGGGSFETGPPTGFETLCDGNDVEDDYKCRGCNPALCDQDVGRCRIATMRAVQWYLEEVDKTPTDFYVVDDTGVTTWKTPWFAKEIFDIYDDDSVNDTANWDPSDEEANMGGTNAVQESCVAEGVYNAYNLDSIYQACDQGTCAAGQCTAKRCVSAGTDTTLCAGIGYCQIGDNGCENTMDVNWLD